MYYNTDIERGFDCVKTTKSKGTEIVAHFATYDEAWDYAHKHKGVCVRYYAKQ